MSTLNKAVENLSHAVSAFQGDKDSYLFEAAKEVVEALYPQAEPVLVNKIWAETDEAKLDEKLRNAGMDPDGLLAKANTIIDQVFLPGSDLAAPVDEVIRALMDAGYCHRFPVEHAEEREMYEKVMGACERIQAARRAGHPTGVKA